MYYCVVSCIHTLYVVYTSQFVPNICIIFSLKLILHVIDHRPNTGRHVRHCSVCAHDLSLFSQPVRLSVAAEFFSFFSPSFRRSHVSVEHHARSSRGGGDRCRAWPTWRTARTPLGFSPAPPYPLGCSHPSERAPLSAYALSRTSGALTSRTLTYSGALPMKNIGLKMFHDVFTHVRKQPKHT